MTRIYVAAAVGERAAAKQIATALTDLGHIITSTWFDTTATVDPTDPQARRHVADKCVEEVAEADVVVLIQAGRPRGAYYEAGVADALGLTVIWLDTYGPVFDARGIVVPSIGQNAREIAARVDAVLPRRRAA